MNRRIVPGGSHRRARSDDQMVNVQLSCNSGLS